MPVAWPAFEAALTAELTGIFADTGPTVTPAAKAEAIAGAISTQLQAAVGQMTVTVPPGVAVATAGTPAAQTGATTAPGVGTVA